MKAISIKDNALTNVLDLYEQLHYIAKLLIAHVFSTSVFQSIKESSMWALCCMVLWLSHL